MSQPLNLFRRFCIAAELRPDHAAIIDRSSGATTSYRELHSLIEDAAARLREAGVRPGMCIGLHYPSGFDYIVWAYATWACEAVVVPIAVELVPDEKSALSTSIQLSGIISMPGGEKYFDKVRAGGDQDLGGSARFVPVQSDTSHPEGLEGLNPAFIRFTSGTTSTSKGVVLSHETVFDRIMAANAGLAIGPDDRVIWLLSMSYHFTVSIVAYLQFGATVILCSDHFGKTIVGTAAAHEATIIYGSPVHYHFMAHDATGTALPHLRLAISTASSLREETADAFLARFGIPLNQAYGIIEIGLPCINLTRSPENRTSVGKPLPDYEVRLRDVGLGADLMAIDIRGKGIVDAYYDPWMPRSEIMEDGWFRTGDLGRFDAEGNLHILGRSKEMISVAGMKFFPQEIEAILEEHPSVKEAYVFGRPDPRMGEVPQARVVPADGGTGIDERTLRDFCLERASAYKVPEKIEVADALPRTASGKLVRHQIRVGE